MYSMKIKNIIPFILVTLILSLNSCYDNKMEWGRDPSQGEITTSELPLALQEKISRYDVLTAYTDFKLGAGIDFGMYRTNEAYRNIVNQNFDGITPGNEMKQSSIMNAKGELNFTNADNGLAQLPAGMAIWGHTLVWHNQAQAAYMNSLLQPTIIPGTPGESILDVSALLDGSFTGWNRNNAGGITIDQSAGLNGGPAVKFNVTTAGNEWDTQLFSPKMHAVVGHAYQFSFWIRSEGGGQGRMSFQGMRNNYPYIGSGPYFTAGGSWTQVIYNQVWDNATSANVPFTATADVIQCAFDLGKFPDTYYVDVNTINVIDLDAAPAEVNLVQNGGFETGDLTHWSALNAGAGIEVTNEQKYAGNYSVKMVSSSTSSQAWNLQLESDQITLDAGKTYTFSFYVKSDIAGKGRVSFPGGIDGNQYPWMNWDGSGSGEAFTTSSSWKLISVDLTNSTKIKLSFDMGYFPDVTYYIDEVKVVEKPSVASAPKLRSMTSGPTEIPQTPEEKAFKVDSVLHAWISAMTTHFKDRVIAWDVVNEPLNDNGTLRQGVEDLSATSVFYWQYYLGKDYAVKAFKWAREGDPNAKLFINDYGLESPNGIKVDSLIKYVQYIESQGAKVDGIGTQMHLNINWTDTLGVKLMFEKLAASGKLIRITEMDVAIANTSNPASPISPTANQFAQQAELYRYVADMYTRIIPKAQQFGITVWGVSDSPDEHAYWLTNDAPNLWDANFARKHAYMGFANGLAGRDVSVDFPGDLIIP